MTTDEMVYDFGSGFEVQFVVTLSTMGTGWFCKTGKSFWRRGSGYGLLVYTAGLHMPKATNATQHRAVQEDCIG